MRTQLALLVPLTLAAAPALAGQLEITSVDASSYYTESGNYQAERIADGKQGTAWVEGEEGSGLGAYVQLGFGGKKKVTHVRVWPGDWYSYNSWEQAGRPKELELKFDDDSTQVITLEDAWKPQQHKLETPKETAGVRVRIKSVYSGSTWFDTGISEIQFFDGDTTPGLKATVEASTVAKEDGDGTYVTRNLHDGVTDSMWCEGVTDGDGSGATLTFDFGREVDVSTLHLVNGPTSSLSVRLKSSLATELTLEAGGKTFTVEPSSKRDLQALSFPKVTTSKVKLTVSGAKTGREYTAICLGEAWFSE